MRLAYTARILIRMFQSALPFAMASPVLAVEPQGPRQFTHAVLLSCLRHILQTGGLSAVYQPIVNLRSGKLLGYEGLIRGPIHAPLQAPADLFKVAGENDLTEEIESLCCRTVADQFVHLGLEGKLFINISPAVLVAIADQLVQFTCVASAHDRGSGRSIVFELTESHCPPSDYDKLDEVLRQLRAAGFQFAIDDLGEGFSSLRRWSELQPEFVKIDRHFVRDVHGDALKQQFIRSIVDIARKSRARVIAEGVETEAELAFLLEAGIESAQGFYLGRPEAEPPRSLEGVVKASLERCMALHARLPLPQQEGRVKAGALLRAVPVVTPSMSNNEVYEMFSLQPTLQTLPVVDQDKPVGIITRASLIDRFARPYQRELYGKRVCTLFMDDRPPMADKDTSLQKLSHILMEADRARLINDFIITDRGRYLGIGTTHDLLRELTELQISAAKYANPLSMLPGNVPTNQHVDQLLQAEVAFCICYADIDNFKPFNDVFGYAKGDDLIRMTGRVLTEHANSHADFVGHIGGDDFLLVFQSSDWRGRCESILERFSPMVISYMQSDHIGEDWVEDGYLARDRKGRVQRFPLPSLSLGVVMVEPGQYESYNQIAMVSARAKLEAKKTAGNSLYVMGQAVHG